MQGYNELFLLPFFMDARVNFMDTRVTPFTSAEFGYAFTRHEVFGFNTNYQDHGGMMASLDGGLKYQVLPAMALNFSLGYAYQEVNVENEYTYYNSYNGGTSKRSMNQFKIRIGLTF